VVRPAVAAQQKAPGLDVTGGPYHVADALEAEHGVEEKEGHHVDVVGGVGGAGGDKRGHGTGLGDALLQYLAIGGLLVVKQGAAVHRFVVLAHVGVDADFAEQALHAKGARFVGHDGNDIAPDFIVRQQLGQEGHHGHGGGHLTIARAVDKFGVQGFGRRSEDGH
jgi:hypothetical protein